jgi:hypothetical protein
MATLWSLGPDSVAALQALPETGMGFQLVNAQIEGRAAVMLVLNCEDAYDISDVVLGRETDAATILANSWRVIEAIARATKGSRTLETARSVRLRAGFLRRVRPGALVRPPWRFPRSYRRAPLVTSYALTVDRVFHRFSAFKNDRRVNASTGDFLPGTYAAPQSEVRLVPTGFAAVGRFALPNVKPASHHYVVQAPSGTAVTFGAVAPAFSQAGGGVEVVFPSGVTNNATPYVPPSTIPDE